MISASSIDSRSRSGVDCRGLTLSYNDPEAIAGLEQAHEASLAFGGDAIALIDEVIAKHPDFIMAHIFKAGWLTQAMETRIYVEMKDAVRAAERLADRANDRERGHFTAVWRWLEGDFAGAVSAWEEVAIAYPTDLLAIQLAHLSDVLLGDTVGQRDVVARAFKSWDETVPGYAFMLGFYAFGLEEMRDFERAEAMARRSLDLLPDNPYAVHALGHVMESQGRIEEGIAFFKAEQPRWEHTSFANHLWWHLALYYFDKDDVGAVLGIYDRHLRSVDPNSYQELDAAALLWRLKLLDVDLADRWSELADKWTHAATNALYAFNDAHAMMTFVGDDRHDVQDTLLLANDRHAQCGRDTNAMMIREVGLPLCRALQDFHRGSYEACVERLMPIRYRTHLLGGSHAQRDVIGLTLLEAALRAGRFPLAWALASERFELRPDSIRNREFLMRARKGLEDSGVILPGNADRIDHELERAS
ncbi:MAG: tetratricopeptide repeat protein [Pseudomonadota bacterium]